MIALTPPFTRLAASRLSCPTSASASKRSLSTYRDIKVLPFTQKQLYRVIADIDSYSAFIPFLTSSKVLNAPPDGSKPWLEEPEDEKVELQSELAVGFAGFQEKYVSKNVCTKFHSVTAEAEAQDLFHHLSTTWRLTPHPLKMMSLTSAQGNRETIKEATKVEYELSYEFSNPLYAMAASSKFDKVAHKIMKGFEKRCHEVYPVHQHKHKGQ